jgi:O-antigen/teichoic acid export membrane protein
LKEAFIIYFERIVNVFTGFLLSYLVINYFSQNDYGIYKYVMSLGSLFIVFAMLGFNLANIRFIPEYILHKEYKKINYQIFYFAVIQIAFIIVSLITVYILYINKILQIDNQIDIRYLYVIFIGYYIKSYFAESLLVAFSKRIILTYLRIILYFIQVIIIYYAIYNNVNIKDFIYYVMLFSIIEAFVLTLGIISVYKKLIPSFTFNKFNLNKQYNYSFNNYGFIIVNFLRDNAATIVVVSYLFNYTEVAYYSVALIIPNIVRGFSPSKVFSGLIMPEFVKKYKQNGEEQEIFDGLNFMGKINIIFLIPAVIYSIFMYQFVISTFFSMDYAINSFHLSIFLFLNIVLMSYLDLNLLASNILEKSDLVFKLNLFSISNIVLLLILSELGRISIGIANLLSTFFTVFAFWIVLQKYFQNRINFYFLNKEIIIYFIVLLAFSFGLYLFNIYVYMIVFLIVSMIAILYIIKSNFINTQERKFLQSKLPQKIKGWI